MKISKIHINTAFVALALVSLVGLNACGDTSTVDGAEAVTATNP